MLDSATTALRPFSGQAERTFSLHYFILARRPARRLLAWLWLLALAGVVLVACGGVDEPAATAVPSATPTAKQMLDRASQRLAATEALRFNLTVDGETYVDTPRTIRLLGAEGDIQRPDRVQTTFTAQVLRTATVTIQLIAVGDQTWTTNILTGAWGPAPPEFEYRPFMLFDNDTGIGPAMRSVTDVQMLDAEDISGRPTLRVRALVDGALIAPLTAYTMTGSPVTVDLWIDRKTDDLLRARLAEPRRDNDAPGATWTLDLSKHGEPVTIEPPV